MGGGGVIFLRFPRLKALWKYCIRLPDAPDAISVFPRNRRSYSSWNQYFLFPFRPSYAAGRRCRHNRPTRDICVILRSRLKPARCLETCGPPPLSYYASAPPRIMIGGPFSACGNPRGEEECSLHSLSSRYFPNRLSVVLFSSSSLSRGATRYTTRHYPSELLFVSIPFPFFFCSFFEI
jgi:hypothetical protein